MVGVWACSNQNRQKQLTPTSRARRGMSSWNAVWPTRDCCWLSPRKTTVTSSVHSLQELLRRQKIDALPRSDTLASTEVETNFWHQYDSLAVALAPVSASSIRHTENTKNGGTSPTRWLFAGSIACLFIFIVLQTFGVAGSDLLNQLRATEKAQSSLLAANREFSKTSDLENYKLLELDTELAGMCPEPGGIPNGATRASTQVTKGKCEEFGRNQAAERKSTSQKQMEAFVGTASNSQLIDDLQNRVKPAQALLEYWYEPFSKLFMLVSLDAKYEKKATDIRSQYSNSVMDGSKNSERIRKMNAIAMKLALDSLVIEKTRAVQNMTSFLLTPINLYLIPAMLGLLGAVTYMMRSVSAQLVQYSYIPMPKGMTMARITIGMVGGVIGSMLVTGTSLGDSSLKVLPPLGVPFLFGYAVDVFFALLDKIVGTFTGNEAKPLQR